MCQLHISPSYFSFSEVCLNLFFDGNDVWYLLFKVGILVFQGELWKVLEFFFTIKIRKFSPFLSRFRPFIFWGFLCVKISDWNLILYVCTSLEDLIFNLKFDFWVSWPVTWSISVLLRTEQMQQMLIFVLHIAYLLFELMIFMLILRYALRLMHEGIGHLHFKICFLLSL